MSSMRNKTSTKKVTKKVKTQRWQCWHDQLMMCFSLFFSEQICRCFKGILCFIQSSHATALSHIIVAMSSPARSRSPMREKACWLVNSFIPDSAELIVVVLWGAIEVAMLHNWPLEVFTKHGWSSFCSLISHVEQPTEAWSSSVCSISFCIKIITVVVSSVYLPSSPRWSNFQKCFFNQLICFGFETAQQKRPAALPGWFPGGIERCDLGFRITACTVGSSGWFGGQWVDFSGWEGGHFATVGGSPWVKMYPICWSFTFGVPHYPI